MSEQRADGFRQRGLAVTRLETFVDAAFAFALTLLMISTGDRRPGTVGELHDALLRVPTFLACFALIASFWLAHERWSRRFGLEDRRTVLLSLALVAATLVWVFPLRMVVSSGLWFLSGGALPSELAMRSGGELQSAFRIFAVGFAGLSLIVLLLNLHALRLRDQLGLDAREQLETRGEVRHGAINIAVAALSFVVSFLVLGSTIPWVMGLPGFLYATLAIALPLHRHLLRRERATLPSD